MERYKGVGIALIVFGVITLAGSAFIYSYQMSQDGDLVYENGNLYELRANPKVLSLMTAGMVVGGSCILLGIVVIVIEGDRSKINRIDPREQDRLMKSRNAPSQPRPASKVPVTVIGAPERSVSYCQGCGRQAVPGAVFCEGCGRRLN